MATKIAFVPFDDQEIRDMAQAVVDNFDRTTRFARMFRDKFDVRLRVYSATTPTPLKDVAQSAQVYIFGHGEAQAAHISGGNGMNMLTMPELAARLEEAGLKKDHKLVKLHACRGGEGGSGSMAYRLWDAMKTEGYNGVKVCGYHKYLASYVDESGNKLGADLQFDASGQITDVSNETRQKDLRVCWP